MRTLVTKGAARPFDVWEIIDHLRVPWAILLAESLTFFLYRADIALERALAAGASVLVVRAAFGILLGTPAPPAVRLTSDEKTLVQHIVCEGLTDAQIGVLLHVPEKSVGKRLKPILAKLGCADREELESWAVSAGFCSIPIYDRPEVRRILTGSAFIGAAWTLFQILRTLCQTIGWCST
jgi:DNA-binding CsgD family transcriptional regulator